MKTVFVRGWVMFLSGVILMLAFGWGVFPSLIYTSQEQPLQFSHRVHTGESVGMTCEDCHSFRSDGSFTGIPKLEKCATCHAAQVGTTAEEKQLVDEYVTGAREIPWNVYSRQPMNAYFSHIQHVKTAKIACADCHGDHGSSDRLPAVQVNRISGYRRATDSEAVSGVGFMPSEIMSMDDCAHCHARNGRSENCLQCHK